MEINATQKMVIDIDESEEKRICQHHLYRKFDWKSSYFIKDGWVMENNEAHTTHSFEYENKIRKANDVDRCIEHVLKFL